MLKHTEERKSLKNALIYRHGTKFYSLNKILPSAFRKLCFYNTLMGVFSTMKINDVIMKQGGKLG